jgi:hypothetical protein
MNHIFVHLHCFIVCSLSYFALFHGVFHFHLSFWVGVAPCGCQLPLGASSLMGASSSLWFRGQQSNKDWAKNRSAVNTYVCCCGKNINIKRTRHNLATVAYKTPGISSGHPRPLQATPGHRHQPGFRRKGQGLEKNRGQIRC